MVSAETMKLLLPVRRGGQPPRGECLDYELQLPVCRGAGRDELVLAMRPSQMDIRIGAAAR